MLAGVLGLATPALLASFPSHLNLLPLGSSWDPSHVKDLYSNSCPAICF